MTTPIASFLFWCAAVNYGVLLLAFFGFVTAREPMFRLHSRWFELSRSQFHAVAYGFFGLYKLAIWVLMLVPAFVIWGLR